MDERYLSGTRFVATRHFIRVVQLLGTSLTSRVRGHMSNIRGPRIHIEDLINIEYPNNLLVIRNYRLTSLTYTVRGQTAGNSAEAITINWDARDA